VLHLLMSVRARAAKCIQFCMDKVMDEALRRKKRRQQKLRCVSLPCGVRLPRTLGTDGRGTSE
jgi:hypothetical protein